MSTGLVADILDLGVMNWNDAMYTSETSTSGGYDDWYLPSKGQLLTMRNTIGIAGPDGDIGGFVNNIYWSSTIDEDWGCECAMVVGFVLETDPDGFPADFDQLAGVRAIRSF